jgi:hypothetical protein
MGAIRSPPSDNNRAAASSHEPSRREHRCRAVLNASSTCGPELHTARCTPLRITPRTAGARRQWPRSRSIGQDRRVRCKPTARLRIASAAAIDAPLQAPGPRRCRPSPGVPTRRCPRGVQQLRGPHPPTHVFPSHTRSATVASRSCLPLIRRVRVNRPADCGRVVATGLFPAL